MIRPRLSPALASYAASIGAVCAATALLWLARTDFDKGQASLLYLPIVIASAVAFGFGPSVAAAALSFVCWDFFFLRPYYTLHVADPHDWLSLFIFLIAAVTTARLASRAREQAARARARESEIAVLFDASETLSRKIEPAEVIGALSDQLRTLCGASECIVWRVSRSADSGPDRLAKFERGEDSSLPSRAQATLAESAVSNDQLIGFDASSRSLWQRALGGDCPVEGAYIPLRAAGRVVGALHVGAKRDGKAFSLLDKRLILTLANHAAVVIARESLADQAAQAAALREADVLKDALLAMVSHELRSPLAAIKATATGLAQRRDRGGGDGDDLRAITSEADRLAGLVGSLLDLSRLEGGAWQPERDWCDLAEIIATALDRLPAADADRVRVGISHDTPLVSADYVQIALVLENLMTNAVKYAPANTVIEVDVAPGYNGCEETPSAVSIRVRDYGAGIAPGEEERVFRRFYRGAAHQESAVRGTGIGLALAAAIVSAHGGRIWAANVQPPGLPGAVFTVLLPLE